MYRKLLKAGTWVFIGILFGRLLGFVREFVIVSKYGASEQADRLVVMLTMPDLFLNILVAGSLGAAFIPEFKRMKEEDSRALFIQARISIFVVFSIITFLLIVLGPWLIQMMVPGFSGQSVEELTLATRIQLWMIPLTALSALYAAYLQAYDRFAVSSLGTLIFNVAIVAGLLAMNEFDLQWLALFVIAGAALRVLPQWIQARGISVRSRTNKLTPWFIHKSLIIRYLQATAAGSFLFVLPFIVRFFVSFGEQGAVSLFNYSLKIIELPLGMVLSVIPVVFFPKLSELFASEEPKDYRLMHIGVQITFALSICLMAILLFYSYEIVDVLFGWGQLDDDQIRTIAGLVSIAAIGLPAQALVSYTQIIFHARQDMKTPFLISCASVIILVLINGAFYRNISLQQVAVSIVITYWIIFSLHLLYLKRKQSLTIFHKVTYLPIAYSLFAAIVVVWLASYLSERVGAGSVVSLIIAFVSGCLSLGGAVIVLPELRAILKRSISRRKSLHDQVDVHYEQF